jgi:hypothetical protein
MFSLMASFYHTARAVRNVLYYGTAGRGDDKRFVARVVLKGRRFMNPPSQTQPIDDQQTPRGFSPIHIASVLITGLLFLLLALAVVGLFYSKINYLVGIALMLPAIGFALIFQRLLHHYGPSTTPPPLWPLQEEDVSPESELASDWPLATEGQPEM